MNDVVDSFVTVNEGFASVNEELERTKAKFKSKIRPGTGTETDLAWERITSLIDSTKRVLIQDSTDMAGYEHATNVMIEQGIATELRNQLERFQQALTVELDTIPIDDRSFNFDDR